MKQKRKLTRRQKERLAFRAAISVGVAVLVLLTACFVFALVRKITWSDMLLDLAYSTAAVGDGQRLYAEHDGTETEVCYANAKRVMNFIQNGGRGKFRLIKPEGQGEIFLDYGNGTTIVLTDLGGDAVWMEYESPRRRYSTPLGYMTQFSKLSRLVSPEGGADANALWEEKDP